KAWAAQALKARIIRRSVTLRSVQSLNQADEEIPSYPSNSPLTIGQGALGYERSRFMSAKLVDNRREHRIRRLLWLALSFMLLLCFAPNATAQHYHQTNLVSDIPGLATFTDANLANPWGVAHSASSPWWVADNVTGVSTVYNGSGQPFPTNSPLVVEIPTREGGTGHGMPTGIVFNGSSDFELAPGQPARFIFVTLDGTISGWNQAVDPSHAIRKVNKPGSAIYTGLALGSRAGANYLYVANFHAGTVDVFDTHFSPVTLPSGAFTDPGLPPDFAPFNVQNINGNLFVAFAKQDEDKEDEVEGPGLGFVDSFDTNGHLRMRLKSGRWFNAPWGVVLAPDHFGKFSNDLLVGNLGSGQIAAFDTKHGKFQGLLKGDHGAPIEIEGLWGLGFGNGGTAGPTNTLFFAAGIEDETHGLL